MGTENNTQNTSKIHKNNLKFFLYSLSKFSLYTYHNLNKQYKYIQIPGLKMFLLVVEHNNGNHINSNTDQLLGARFVKEVLVFYYPSQQTCYVTFTYENHRNVINEHDSIKIKQNLYAINIFLFILQMNACLQWRNET